MKKQILIILLLILLLITGCNKNNVNESYVYDDSEYSFGNTTLNNETIQEISVDWLVGNIVISKQLTNELIIREEKDTSLNDDYKFRYMVKDNKVDIKFTKSMETLNYNFRIKNLYIYVPSYITKINIQSHKANVKCDSLVLNDLIINGEKSSIDINNANISSLDITNLKDEIILFNNEFSKVKIDTKESNIGLTINDSLNMLDIKSQKGNISLYVSDSFDCTLHYQTNSGEFKTKLNYAVKDNNYIFNTGKFNFYIESNTGNLNVFKK